MATSDVLQFNCSIENEVARNATEDFARMLGKAFDQYKKLWNEYLMLRKYCEDNDVKIPFQVLESETCLSTNINALSKISEHCVEPSSEHLTQGSPSETIYSSMVENISNVCDSDFSSEFDDTVSRKDELLKSPVLVQKRKSKKHSVNAVILDESAETSSCILLKENISISEKNSQPNVCEMSAQSVQSDCCIIENNDQIECTPISKIPKKLGVSKLYNVETTLLENGKKLRQSKLVFFGSESKTDSLKSNILSTPEKNVAENSKVRMKSTDEEIIESSPTKRVKSNFKVKSLKLKKKSPTKSLGKNCAFSKVFQSKINDAKTSMAKINQPNASQYIPPTQKDESCSMKKSKTFSSSCSTPNDCDSINSLVSPVLVGFEDCFDDIDFSTELSVPVKETKEAETTKNDSQGHKRTLVELNNQSIYDSSAYDETYCVLGEQFKTNIVGNTGELKKQVYESKSTPIKEIKEAEIMKNNNQRQKRKFVELNNQSICDSTYDETYCVLGEQRKENIAVNAGKLEKEVCKRKLLSPSPPVKKSLMSSFDMLSEKKDISIQTSSKSKSERIKMNGVSCWECKQYYSDLGLSENEMRTRQNQCSRHRIKYSQKQSTPNGFWDPLFPDTYTSTFEEDN